jgi:hypothetical protein
MTNRKHIGLAASLVLGTLALSAIASPAGARWYSNGTWVPDYRWQSSDRYYGYYYRPPAVVYGTPYNYGYYAPPVIYDSAPGFTFTIRP